MARKAKKKWKWRGGQGKVINSLGSKREREFHWQNHLWAEGSSSDTISSQHPTFPFGAALQGPPASRIHFPTSPGLAAVRGAECRLPGPTAARTTPRSSAGLTEAVVAERPGRRKRRTGPSGRWPQPEISGRERDFFFDRAFKRPQWPRTPPAAERGGRAEGRGRRAGPARRPEGSRPEGGTRVG